MPKLTAALLSACLIAGCQTNKISTVRLRPVEETGLVLSSSEHRLRSRPPADDEVMMARQMKLDSFAIFEFDHKQWERALQKQEDDDNGGLPAVDLLDARSTFLAGFKGSKMVVVADANNNNDLSDDEVINVNRSLLRGRKYNDLSRMPHVQLKGLRTIYDGRDIMFQRSVYLLPDTITDGGLNLILISNEQNEGIFKYKKHTYTVRARQSAAPGFKPVAEGVLIRIDSASCPLKAKYDSNATGRLNDTLWAGRTAFVVTDVSPFIERMNISAVPPVKSKKKSR